MRSAEWELSIASLPEQGLVGPGDLVSAPTPIPVLTGHWALFHRSGQHGYGGRHGLREVWLKVPPSIRFHYYGTLPPRVGGKDLILYTIGRIGVDGALYSAMEFTGEAVAALTMDDRFTMANMAIEAGAKNRIFPVDEKTLTYIEGRLKRSYKVYASDPEAEYAKEYEFDVSQLEPQVALPHLPENARPVSQVTDVRIDQVVIGSCTNGRMKDLREAAQLLKGKQVHPEVRLIVIPGTQEIYLQALKEGLISIFIEAGGLFPPRPAGRVSGDTWGSWPVVKRRWLPPTGILSGAWGTPRAKSIWPGRRWRRPRR